MRSSAVDVLLHPVRLRVARALAAAPGATVNELSLELPDVPPATLYRHVNKLARAGIIEAVSERPVRGAVERRFRLAHGVLGSADLAAATRADHLRYFVTFVATTIDDFAAYLERGEPQFERDGVGYRQVTLNLTDVEFRQLATALSTTLAPFVGKRPTKARTPRLFSTIAMPAVPRSHPKGRHAT